MKVKDIFDERGQFLTQEDLERNFKIKTNFLDINKLKRAIPKPWVNMLCGQGEVRAVQDTDQAGFTFSTINSLTALGCYKILVKQKATPPVAKLKWEKEILIQEENWPKIYMLPYSTTRETKLQSFQFKLLHRIIPCKKWLFNIKISDSPLCVACGETDDLAHFFYLCPDIKAFWQSFQLWWQNNIGQRTVLQTEDVLFGLYECVQNKYQLNYIILAAKWFIYGKKLQEKKPCFYDFLPVLKLKIKVEKCVLLGQNKAHLFDKHWAKIYDSL